MSDFVEKDDLLPYLESILRVYNLHGRRDNLFKARIKILVHAIGAEAMRSQVNETFEKIKNHKRLRLPAEEEARIRAYFAPPAYDETLEDSMPEGDEAFNRFTRVNCVPHRKAGYTILNISLKTPEIAPGDASSEQMEIIADLAEKYSFDEIRVSHEQNLTLAHVAKKDLPAIYAILKEHGLATANIGLISDQITCPGLDYCNLANARSIPIAQSIARRFQDPQKQEDIGAMKIKISGCMNACGHHHVGHIGILGVDKKGTEYYQITLGGSADENAAIGQLIGPAFTEDDVVNAIENIVDTYRALRQGEEDFLATWRRLGNAPFKERLYAD
jgi:sulfite reductase (NADPH) hemoprotein beta-component